MSASIPSKVARRFGLHKLAVVGAAAKAEAGHGFAASSSVLVAHGHATASGPGKVTIKLRPTKAAKRAAKRMRGVKLTVRASQAGVAAATSVKLR